ncbi:Zn-dependent hydrolase, partial [filamentous cyanobacterium CCP5]
MKRRELVKYAGAGFLATLGLGITASWQTYQAQTSGVTLRWLGHTSFLFTGGGRRLLVNPFRPIGCTAGYRPGN